MYNRFNLEGELHKVMWSTVDDLDTILYRMMDAPESPSEDEIINMIFGLRELHSARSLKLWDVFETMVKDDCFISEERNRFLEAETISSDLDEEREGVKKSESDSVGDSDVSPK